MSPELPTQVPADASGLQSSRRALSWSCPNDRPDTAPEAFLLLEIHKGAFFPCTAVQQFFPQLEGHKGCDVMLEIWHELVPATGIANIDGRHCFRWHCRTIVGVLYL